VRAELLTLVLVLLVAAAVTYLLTPAVRRFAIRIGAQTEVRARDVHKEPTPRLGGLAMYGGLAATMLVAGFLPVLQEVFDRNNTWDTWTGTWTALLAGGGLLVVIGIIDDRYEMDALTKFAGQVTAAGILVLRGIQLAWLPLPEAGTLPLPTDYGAVLTILVVVATINAVNFVDGLDGLAAGIVGISALAFLTYAFWLVTVVGIPKLLIPAVISAALAGVCLGFLPHNFNPARLFMGDTGSMLLGFLLASSAISILSELDPAAVGSEVNRFPTILPLLIPIIVLVVPYADMLLAVVRRTYDGRSPFAPDKKHLHHRLLALGHSHRGAALIMYLWTGVFSFGVVTLSFLRSPLLVLSIASGVALLALVLMVLPQWRGRSLEQAVETAAGTAGEPEGSPPGPPSAPTPPPTPPGPPSPPPTSPPAPPASGSSPWSPSS
jgi:UDP-GlcNAc:undecaprenyl-phosphate/decaprenyl-phosphate GlcNAc-1-phosphate transferase